MDKIRQMFFLKMVQGRFRRPATGPSWMPLAQEQAYTNDRFNTPVTYQGQPVWKIRTVIVPEVYIIPDKTY